VPTTLTDLPAGHVFEPLTLTIDPERVRAYCAAAGDSLSVYDDAGFVPPLAIAAFALGVLLESVSLPGGSLHANESLTFRKAVPAGASVECQASLAQRSQRSGWVVSVLDSDIRLDGETAITARATVLSPQAGS
jgi:hypothetical protein